VIINGKVPHDGAARIVHRAWRRHADERAGRGRASERMSETETRASGFDHVEAWVFDLDNTLYPPTAICSADRPAHGRVHSNSFGIPLDEAQRLR